MAIPAWAGPVTTIAGVALVGLVIGIAARYLLSAVLQPMLKRTKATWDDDLARALSPGVPVLLMVAGMWVGLQKVEVVLKPWVVQALQATVLGLGAWAVAILVSRIVRVAIEIRVARKPRFRPVANVARTAVAVTAYTVAALVVLGSMGVEITPILASLGIGGLAVALALQDSLSNMFSGLWMRASRDIHPGHFVRLEDKKLDGHIESIGWRTTRIRTGANNLIIVPNAVLSQSVVTNFTYPDARTQLTLLVRVGLEADPDKIATILVEETEAAAPTTPGLLVDTKPLAHLTNFGEFALEFTLVAQVRSVSDLGAAQDALRRRILRRFLHEGVRIPYPIRETVQAMSPGSPGPNSPPRGPNGVSGDGGDGRDGRDDGTGRDGDAAAAAAVATRRPRNR